MAGDRARRAAHRARRGSSPPARRTRASRAAREGSQRESGRPFVLASIVPPKGPGDSTARITRTDALREAHDALRSAICPYNRGVSRPGNRRVMPFDSHLNDALLFATVCLALV